MGIQDMQCTLKDETPRVLGNRCWVWMDCGPNVVGFSDLGERKQRSWFSGEILSFCVSLMGSTFTFKFLKRSSALWVIREMQMAVRPWRGTTAPPVGWLQQRDCGSRVGQDGEAGTLSQCWWEGKWDRSFGNQLGSFLKCSTYTCSTTPPPHS